MTTPRPLAPTLLWRARLRLAALSLFVMGTLLYAAGFAMGRLLLQTQEAALRRELQTLAGTLHDSLKPGLPRVAQPSASLAAVLPGLCVVGKPCSAPESLVRRHAVSVTDPDRYQLSMLDHHGRLVAFSPGAPQSDARSIQLGWRWQRDLGGHRYAAYTIHLHDSNAPGEPIWGYLQILSSLEDFDAEAERLWWLGHGVFALAMAGMALASWWLAGLAMAPLLEAYRRQEQFSADVAHELRTPLANLLALVEAERAALDCTPGQALTYGLSPGKPATEAPTEAGLERMLKQVWRLQRLISDLLLLASLERKVNRSHLQQVNLAEISADVIEDLSETAVQAGVTLETAIDDIDATVLGLEAELSRLLINLLSNAIQHSPDGGTVQLNLERIGPDIQVSVRDSGPGIPSEVHRQIFERFQRLDPARCRRQGGTGLGLAIAQAIASRHRGVIRLESRLGEGATFFLRLSAAKPRAESAPYPGGGHGRL